MITSVKPLKVSENQMLSDLEKLHAEIRGDALEGEFTTSEYSTKLGISNKSAYDELNRGCELGWVTRRVPEGGRKVFWKIAKEISNMSRR